MAVGGPGNRPNIYENQVPDGNAGAPDAGARNAANAAPVVLRRLNDREERERLEKICNDAANYFRDVSSQMQCLIAELQGLAREVHEIAEYAGAIRALQGAQGLADSIVSGIPEARRQCREALAQAERVIAHPPHPIEADRLVQIRGLMSNLQNLLGDGNVVDAPQVAGRPRANAGVPQRVPQVPVQVLRGEESSEESSDESGEKVPPPPQPVFHGDRLRNIGNADDCLEDGDNAPEEGEESVDVVVDQPGNPGGLPNDRDESWDKS